MLMNLPRIRRKFALLISLAVFSVIIIFYILINQSISPYKTDNLKLLENKLKILENGLDKHEAEVGEMRKQINTIQSQSINNNNNNNQEGAIVAESQILKNHQNDKDDKLDQNEMVKESVIVADVNLHNQEHNQCSFRVDKAPTPDIQMMDLYHQMPFDNQNGGAWKQGWKLSYDLHQWNAHHKLNVFVVPHSHNDPGWLKTYDEYYEQTTKAILTNMLNQLNDNPTMTFIWAEISYFSRWHKTITPDQKKIVKKLVKSGQLEFVTGGWVMPDEANSHWISVLHQLSEGQTWLKTHLNVTPISSWAIDPFGHSAVMPFLLKNSGFENLLIQRTHYSVKKKLAQHKNLEFSWRQVWDNTRSTDLFTHMMPFYSYDVPHTCGPDPKVCCQFDFKRLPSYGLTCPWHIPPQIIDDSNVAKRSELIVDQWRKKSTLYRTRSVLIPLGDDFRYSQNSEWEAQRTNFEKLFEYINNEPSLHVSAKFGTLQQYFDSVRKELKIVADTTGSDPLDNIPSLSGDFFTYADRDDHYWSGYFTSRPYHKRLDRILLTYLRSAEMLYSWSVWDKDAKDLEDMLSGARQALSLFQHHDGVAGTGRDHVVQDYARQMKDALKSCSFIIQQAAYRYLTKPSVYQPDYRFTYFNMDDSRTSDQNDNRHTIILGDEVPIKYVVVHNSLPQHREEIVEFLVSKPFVMVTDMDNRNIPSQIVPVWTWHKGLMNSITPQPSTTKYRLIFLAKVPPLGLKTYIIHSTTSKETSIETNYAKITILSENPFTVNLNDYPNKVEFSEPREISIRTVDNEPSVSFNKYGLLKAVSMDSNSDNDPVHLEFLQYGVRRTKETSGAYLFLPDGSAIPLQLGSPTVLVVHGTLESSVTTGLPFAIHENILRSNSALEIRNLIDIRKMDNSEIVMRISTAIQSKEFFYTDLNGLQMLKRERLKKLPLQGNYYPVPSQIFIEDKQMRLTLLSGQPLGGSSLESGQLEIMQDRRLLQDDNRGLGQGVLDNEPVLNIFKLVLENIESCLRPADDHPAGFVTAHSNWELKSLLYPMDKLIWHENEWAGVLPVFGADREPFDSDVEVSIMKNLPHIQSGKKSKSAIGLVVHRTYLQKCTSDVHYSGTVNIRRLLNVEDDREIHSSNITLLKKQTLITTDEIDFCPMDIKGFVIYR